MDVSKLIKATRTYRKFDNSKPISKSTLLELIELGRLGGSARNCQPWQYAIFNNRETCDIIFPHIGWAGYLADWNGPVAEQQPTAYILCLLNHKWLKGSIEEAQFDLGIASQNMLLGATAKGLGGCRIGAFSKTLASKFELAEHHSLELLIALGTPQESVVIEDTDNDIRYWRDSDGVHHVPKRKLTGICIELPLKAS